jgi:hypothetical protein
VPNSGQVNNGSGVNGYTGPGGAETPYGAVKRLGQMTKAAPIGTVPGVNAPQQAKRAAARGQQEPAPVTPDQAVMAQPSVPLPVAYAQAWSAVASTPGASPLVVQMAQEAQRVGA